VHLRATITLDVSRHVVDIEVDIVDALTESHVLNVGLFNLHVGRRLVRLALFFIFHVCVVHVAFFVLQTFVCEVPQAVVRSPQDFSFFLSQLLARHDDRLGGVHRCCLVVNRVRRLRWVGLVRPIGRSVVAVFIVLNSTQMRLRLVSLRHLHLDRLTLLPSVVLVLIGILAKICNL